MAFDPAIGTRVEGKTPGCHSRWYECAVCGKHKKEVDTLIPDPPLPHAGLRICTSCNDEPSYDYFSQVSPYVPTGEENGP